MPTASTTTAPPRAAPIAQQEHAEEAPDEKEPGRHRSVTPSPSTRREDEEQVVDLTGDGVPERPRAASTPTVSVARSITAPPAVALASE